MWEIYSIGDSAFLEQVLNAVAMITGTGDFTSMVRIGLLIGVLMVSVQALMQGGRGINFQHVLVSWLGSVDLCCTYFTQQYMGSHIIENASDTMLA